MKSIIIQKIFVFTSMISAFRDMERGEDGILRPQSTRTDIIPSNYAKLSNVSDNPDDQPISTGLHADPQQIFNAPNNSMQCSSGHTADPNTMNLQPNPSTSFASLVKGFKHMSAPRRYGQKKPSAAKDKTTKLKKSAEKIAPSLLPPSQFINADIPTNICDIEKMLECVQNEIVVRSTLVEASKDVLDVEEPLLESYKAALEKAKNKRYKLQKGKKHYKPGPDKQKTDEYIKVEQDVAYWSRKVNQPVSGAARKVEEETFAKNYYQRQIDKLKEKEAQLMKAKEKHIKQ
ncbi:hypothetical protein ENBRE01_1552 [Enteropsectra breve]|nr:hypothetical protein ENBRE01_1552 [Enteropsectra breve]